jgi:myosin heavy subunit
VRNELVEEHTAALEEQKTLLSSAFAADIRNAEKKLASAREEIALAKSAASAEFSAAGTAQAQIRKLHEEIESKDDEIAKLERKLAAKDSSEDATSESDARAKSDARLDSAKAARKRAEERAQEMEAKVAELMHDVDEANKSSHATKSKYSAARSRIESLEVALHAAKTEIAQLKGIEPPPSVSKTPARTPAVKRTLAGRTPGKTPGAMGTARRILSEMNADDSVSSPSRARPNKHMRFDTSSPTAERTKPTIIKHRAELDGIRRGTGRLLSKPAMRVQSAKPADE